MEGRQSYDKCAAIPLPVVTANQSWLFPGGRDKGSEAFSHARFEPVLALHKSHQQDEAASILAAGGKTHTGPGRNVGVQVEKPCGIT